jgi:vancomycin resistance protein YoaR
MGKVRNYQNLKIKERVGRVLRSKTTKIVAVALIVLLALSLVTFGLYSVSYAKKSYLNIRVGDTNLGGKSRSEITSILSSKSAEFLNEPIVLEYQDNEAPKEYSIAVKDIGLNYDLEKTSESIMNIGRGKGMFGNAWEQLRSIFVIKKIPARYNVNSDAIAKKVMEIAGEIDQPEKDYSIYYLGDGTFGLNEERSSGNRIDQDEIVSGITGQITSYQHRKITFISKTYNPQVKEENARKRLSLANTILSDGELDLNFRDQNFTLDVDTIAGLVLSRTKGDDLELYLDTDRTNKQVEAISAVIDSEPENAKLAVNDGKVSVFQVSKEGRKLDRDQARIDIENALLARAAEQKAEVNTRAVALKVTVTNPEINSADVSKYGLNELVSSGSTNFTKSPANRIHNITVGAAVLNGVLIKPGEEFSTLGALGKIDASTGYLPELVIKEDKTTPEFGGGLCQVSTTLFRAALNAGMEITVRQNHKYRVSYYEPPIGMDATIYDPAPDFKFKNNYVSYILIQSKVVGKKITFEFYGTKDGRIVEIGTPEAYNYVNPGAAIEIPSDTLQPGERKLLERAHQGASAKFHYKVSRGESVLQERDFVSKYVPWPEKWLVGPAAPPEEPPATEPAPTQ